MDLGGKDPGYVLDSTDMHQEGLILPCVRIVKRGKIDDEIVAIIRFNSRMPDVTIGDFHAQLAAIRTGERRFQELVAKFGWETVRGTMELMLLQADVRARERVRGLPDGTWRAVGWLDDDGVGEDPVVMRAAVTIEGDSCLVDFAGSATATRGPVNMPFGATISMVKCLFKSITTPLEPSNGGHYKCLSVSAPEGSLFHAIYPSPTFTLWTQFPAYEVVRQAFSQCLPSVGASSGGDEPGFMVVGVDPTSSRVYSISNNEGIGWGAGPWGDGSSALQHPSTSVVRNTPIEVLETRTPILHHCLELIVDSGGAGRFRGGLGIRREVEFLAEAEVLSMKKKTKTRPWGLAGGLEGSTNGMTVWPGTARETHLGMRRAAMRAGDRFINVSAGGGGYGPPRQRDRSKVRDDVLDGYISSESAAENYGLILEEGDSGAGDVGS
jgi:N-methylhydantoinase B